MLKQVPVSMPCRPLGEMALEGLPRSIRFAVRIDGQHDERHLAPVGTYRIRVEHAHLGGVVLVVVGCEREIGDIRMKGRA